MAESRSNRKKDIESLLAERKKYEAWLAQLDARRQSAAAHVFERVQADYTKRLDAVREELAGEADALKGLVAKLESRLADEQREVTEKTDERAEAELRALVGEFTDTEWESTRGDLDDAITALRTKSDATERELAHVKELLEDVHGAPAAPRPSMLRAAVTSVEDDLADAGRDDARTDSGIEAADAVAKTGTVAAGVAEPGTVVAAVDATVEAVGMGDAAGDPVEAATVDEAGGSVPVPMDEPESPPPAVEAFDELAFLRSVAATPTNPRGNSTVGTRPSGPAPRARQATPMEPVAEPPSRPREAPRAAADPGEDTQPASPLGAPTPRTSQAVRSLKCQECGTLNFPTEWYCERCGGELAAF